ncbi:DUF3043 domain-containing protein [Jatrophihabitans sp.]|uniref:DUF3043 domain-containing protein n=1 Tax=Jatrophihabitans sp. TaxID=1932789 RepID=UPI0030C6E1BB
MKLSRRTPEPAAAVVEAEPADATTKGRPTPKRRDRAGVRGPVTAPKTRKEAYARQKQQTRAAREARKTPAVDMTVAQRRAALKAGDPAVLGKRDQGSTRKLARDYVDSRRLASNYFLVLFLLLIASAAIHAPILQLITLALAVGFIGEWYLMGKRIRRIALERFSETQGGNMTIGFYAGSRAYLPRRWRLPAPQVSLGDEI